VKENILICAERLFKAKGYDKTTFQMIADKLGITKGAISYHFKYKWGIFDELFSGYLKSLHNYIGENLEKNSNSYLHYAIIYICFFRQVMSTKANWDFFYRNEIKNFLQREKFNLFNIMFNKITADFHKNFTAEEINMACHMGIGGVMKLLEEFDIDGEQMPADKYCYYFAYLIGILSLLDEATIKKNIALAFEFLDKHAAPRFSLFD